MTINKLTLAVFAMAALLLQSEVSIADEVTSNKPDRPRIGLVLGGGGARGAAHIGVIRELERQRIPIDAVVGTSMGAIVGGLYASGMTVPELEELVASLDWSDAFQDSVDRRDKRFRRKQDDAAFPMSFELGLRDGSLILPAGVVQGQKLNLILRDLTIDVADVDNFDNLPIPYRAVASDLATGDAAILGSGDLPLAIRASMSAPGIFAPVLIDGRTLVDGGLVGNVPVEAMQQMGVDIIIAVDVEFPLYKPEELQSVVAVSGQMLTILINKETQRQLDMLGENDFLIRPELGEFGSSNFAEITTAVQPGQDATRLIEADLRQYALGEEEFAQHLAARSVEPLEEYIDFVRVTDDGSLSERVLMARVETEPGDRVVTDRLAEDAARLHGLQLYEHVDYRLESSEQDTGVNFIATPKSWGPNFLQFGVSLQDDLEGNTSFNVSARMTRSAVNSLGGEWRVDMQLGTDPAIFTEFYQPLSFDSRYFVAPSLKLSRTNFDVFLNGDNLARFRVSEGGGGLDVGRELGLWGELRAGVFRGAGSTRLNVGSPVFDNNEFQTGEAFVELNIDTLDDAQIPLSGTRAGVTWIASRDGLGADDEYDLYVAAIDHAFTFGRHTFNLGAQYGTSEDSDDLLRNYFTLGGFLNLSALQPGAVSGSHFGLARAVYYRRSGKIKGSFEVPLYIGGSIEAGNAWQSRSDMSIDDTLLNGSLFIGADTFIGPVFLAAGLGEGGEKSLFLSIGQTPR